MFSSENPQTKQQVKQVSVLYPFLVKGGYSGGVSLDEVAETEVLRRHSIKYS